MLVRSLLLATWCLANFECNLVSPVDAPPSFPQLPRHFIKDPGAWKTHLDTPRRERMKRDDMKTCHVMWCYVIMLSISVKYQMTMDLCHLTLLTYLRKRMTWYDKRQAASSFSRISYRERVQVHASMTPSTTSSIAPRGNIGKWAVNPLLIPFDSGFPTHTYIYIYLFICLFVYLFKYIYIYYILWLYIYIYYYIHIIYINIIIIVIIFIVIIIIIIIIYIYI